MKPKKFFKAVDYYKLYYRSDGDVDRGRDFSNFILMPEDKNPERVSQGVVFLMDYLTDS